MGRTWFVGKILYCDERISLLLNKHDNKEEIEGQTLSLF